jgi:hypothetical protein
MTRVLLRVVVALAVSVSGLVAAVPADAADLIACSPFSSHQPGLGFSFRRCGVPDFDQRRDDLPNEGKMYCAPTSALNWMAYVAERGVPFVPPGPGFTGPILDDAEDTAIGGYLKSMGAFMNTHPIDGTTGGTVPGLNSWLAGAGASMAFGIHWSGSLVLPSGDLYTPPVKTIAATAAQGSLTMLSLGWWEQVLTGPTPEDDRFLRVGGHVVSLVGAAPAPDLGTSAYRIVINNPGSALGELEEPDLANQSPFWSDTLATVPRTAEFFTGTGVNTSLHPGVKDQVVGMGNLGLVDGAIFITPKFALLPDPSNDGVDLEFGAGPDWAPLSIDLGSLPGMLDVALAPFGAEHAAVFDTGAVELLNGVDGSRRTLTTVPGARRVTYDDHNRLVVLTGDGLVRVLADGSPDPRTRVPVPTDSDEIAFDPTGGRLVGWDRQTSTLTFLDDDLEIVDRQVVPAVVDPGDPETAVTLTVSPTDGTIGLLADGTSRLVVVPAGTAGGAVEEVTLGSGAALAGLVADSSGVWYSTTQDDNEIVGFDRTGALVEGTPFDGQRAGRRFRIWQPMNIGEPVDSVNVLPEDAPRGRRQLEVTGATHQVAAGEDHRVDLRLSDDGSGPGVVGRSLRWTVTGANASAGTAVTGPDGTAAVSWPGTNVGDDHLVVWEDLDGDAFVDRGEPATSVGESTVAEHLATATQVTAVPTRATIGEAVTLTARVSPADGLPPTGTVIFRDGLAELGTVTIDADGTATLTTAALPAGVHTIAAEYQGDQLFSPSDGRTTLTIERIATRLRAHPVLIRLTPFAVTLRLSASLTDPTGAALAGQPVRFEVGGTTVCTGVTDADGRAVCQRSGLPLVLALLRLGYRAVYDGNATYQPSHDHGPIVS